MLIGYARVSTPDQSLDLQIDALEQAGCEKIYQDVATGAKDNRPGLEKALEHLRKGDVLVVWRLDRLGRSMRHLIQLITDLDEQDIGFMTLTEAIDTTKATGRLVFHIFSALAEFERQLISERTKAGLRSARARGRMGGRPPKLKEPQIRALALMHADPDNTVQEVCDAFGISRKTLYTYLHQYQENNDGSATNANSERRDESPVS